MEATVEARGFLGNEGEDETYIASSYEMEQNRRVSNPGSSSAMGDTASVASTSGSQTSNSARSHPKTVLSDRYHLGEELGRGAFGLVRTLSLTETRWQVFGNANEYLPTNPLYCCAPF